MTAYWPDSLADPLCVCGHGAASSHDIAQVDDALQFGACANPDCCCTRYVERLTYTGTCTSCRAYWTTGQDLAADWYIAARVDQPPISSQIASVLAMYLDHAMAHAGLPTA